MTQGLEVEVVKTCEPDLLLDVDPLLEGRRRLEERVEETEARELERATVVAAQHSWNSAFEVIYKSASIKPTDYELEANRLPEPQPQHRDRVSHHPVSSGQGAHAGEDLQGEA